MILTEYMQDRILWIHILIQITAWGIIFPTGMVLGVRSVHPSARIQLHILTVFIADNQIQVARPCPDTWYPPRSRGLLPRPLPQRSPVLE